MSERWKSNNWISAHFGNPPKSLVSAYKNYIPFEHDLNGKHDKFLAWFRKGMLK